MSQNTITFQKSSPVQALTGLAKQIALPHDHAPQRYPSFPALERTATMSFNHNSSLSIPSSTTISTKVMVARQASFPVWGSTFGGVRDCYSLAFPVEPFSDPLTLADNAPAMATIGTAPSVWTVGATNSGTTAVAMVSGTTPAYVFPVIGVDASAGTMPFLYVPAGYNFAVAVTAGEVCNSTVPLLFSIRYSYWDGPGQVRLDTAALEVTIAAGNRGGSSTSFSFAENQWIRLEGAELRGNGVFETNDMQVTMGVNTGTMTYTASSSNRGSWALGSGAVTSFTPIAYPAEFINSPLPWYSTKTTACAALFTNVTQVLNKGGTVLAGRVAPQIVNPFNASRDYIATLHPAEKNYLGLETGFYTYVPPSTDMADFWDYTLNTAGGAKSCPVYRLDNTSLVNLGFFTSAGVIESLAVNVDWHVEFRTTSSLFQVGLSSLTLESFHQAQLALSTIGYFFPNETHKSLLSRVIAAAGRFARSAFPAVASMVPYANQALKVGSVIHDIIAPTKPPKVIPPTSAARAGIVRATVRQKSKKVKVKRPGKK